MKGIKLGLSIIVASTILLGCQSTASNIIDEQGKLVKYQSRCNGLKQAEEKAVELQPIVRVAPEVPYKAAISKIPGYVKMEFDIAENGKPVNINVIESFPNDLFHNVAINALKKWQYKPVAAQCKSVQLDFEFV
ncbi:energy transducer TonB [Colwellia piezophila]|uniref:energy transducer TonB n=1 Tax=Colwellia piezophila TaxID=211668 RepID=UPI00036F504C|nr:TonB family protein [Colwellia piezophila]